jgi:hypothetical protein
MLTESPYPVRDDLRDALVQAWERVSRPGSFWSGAERIAIATEVRHARTCAFCAINRKAVSPFATDGRHESITDLPDSVVDVVHRMVTDQGRLTPSWYQGVQDSGVTKGQYVETVGVVANVTAVDTMHRGLGMPLPDPGAPVDGEPSEDCSADAEVSMAWVPTISPKRVTGALRDFWFPDGKEYYLAHVTRALSYVPAETIGWSTLGSKMYIGNPMADFVSSPRAITRPQIELLAARTSAHNECFY